MVMHFYRTVKNEANVRLTRVCAIQKLFSLESSRVNTDKYLRRLVERSKAKSINGSKRLLCFNEAITGTIHRLSSRHRNKAEEEFPVLTTSFFPTQVKDTLLPLPLAYLLPVFFDDLFELVSCSLLLELTSTWGLPKLTL